MSLVFAPGALTDIIDSRQWWRANRRDAPDLMATELARAFIELETIAPSVRVFRSIGGLDVRRVHVSRIHRHVYFHFTADGDIAVLAVWGAVRRVLPKLRERLRSTP